jgi:hypothetical protein
VTVSVEAEGASWANYCTLCAPGAGGGGVQLGTLMLDTIFHIDNVLWWRGTHTEHIACPGQCIDGDDLLHVLAGRECRRQHRQWLRGSILVNSVAYRMAPLEGVDKRAACSKKLH